VIRTRFLRRSHRSPRLSAPVRAARGALEEARSGGPKLAAGQLPRARTHLCLEARSVGRRLSSISRSGGVIDAGLTPEHATSPVGRSSRGSSRWHLGRFSERAQVTRDLFRFRHHSDETQPASASRTRQNVQRKCPPHQLRPRPVATPMTVGLGLGLGGLLAGRRRLRGHRHDPRLALRLTRYVLRTSICGPSNAETSGTGRSRKVWPKRATSLGAASTGPHDAAEGLRGSLARGTGGELCVHGGRVRYAGVRRTRMQGDQHRRPEW
jgi:hypothetical protein